MSNDQEQNHNDFSQIHLPKVEKSVFRMGIAGNYGIDSSDIHWAADQGANYWMWTPSFKKVTEGIQQVIQKDREKHVVAMMGWGYLGLQIRLSVEKALRKLKTEYLDVYQLSWLGKMSLYYPGTVETLLKLKQDGKIKAIGTSIHDRQRAGQLAQDSEIDLLMIRYNAKHPGAEQDIFPYVSQRNPAIVSYTALAWRQLTRSLHGIEMPPWPSSPPLQVPPLTPELCYRFVLSNPHVHVVLTGPQNREQLKQNLEAVHRGPLPSEELDWVRQYGKFVKAKKTMDYV